MPSTMNYLPLHSLTRLNGDSTSADYVQNLHDQLEKAAQSSTTPAATTALPAESRARGSQTALNRWVSRLLPSRSRARDARNAQAPPPHAVPRSQSQGQHSLESLRQVAAGARPEPSSHWLERRRRSSAAFPPLRPLGSRRPSPTLASQACPSALPPCWSSSFPSPVAHPVLRQPPAWLVLKTAVLEA